MKKQSKLGAPILRQLLVISTFLSGIAAHAIDSTAELSTNDYQSEHVKSIKSQPYRADKESSSTVAPDQHQHQITLTPLRASPSITFQNEPQTSTPAPNNQNQISATTTLANDYQINPAATSWIESILIHVESVEAQNWSHRNRPGINDNDDDNNNDRNQTNPSQIPTDSSEDALDATTVDSSSPCLNTTQYSLASPQLPFEASRNGFEEDEDDERSVVESNNVTALMAHSRTVNHPTGSSTQQSVLTSLQTPPQQQVSCFEAFNKCGRREACKPALEAFEKNCHETANKTEFCSRDCLNALISLRSSEEGDDLMNCDCLDDESCLKSKERSLACTPQVEKALDPKTKVSCSTASLICLSQTSCLTALDYYSYHCRSLFSLHYCTEACNNSLRILYNQSKASKLIDCYCDGTEEFPCLKYKTYTERLCLDKTNFDATNQQAAILNRDELSNMAHEPKNIEDLVRSASALDDELTTAEDHSSSNRIRPLEDNYYPLVSGRYFSNYDRQRPKHPTQRRHQQQLRKPQKNVRQRSRSLGGIQSQDGRLGRPAAVYANSAASSIISISDLPSLITIFASTWLISTVQYRHSMLCTQFLFN